MSIQDKQNHVGELHNKSDAELRELLQRQQHLLKRSALIKKLPDGGQKIIYLAEKIQHLLDQRQHALDETTQILQQLSLDEGGDARNTNNGDSKTTLRELAQGSCSEKTIVDERDNDVNMVPLKSERKLVSAAKFKPFKTTHVKDVHHLSKDKVRLLQSSVPAKYPDPSAASIQQASIKQSERGTSKTTEHSTDDDNHTATAMAFSKTSQANINPPSTTSAIRDVVTLESQPLPERMDSQSGQTISLPSNAGHLSTVHRTKVRPDQNEDSVSAWRCLHHERVKLIPLQESFELQKQQQEKQEMLQSELAAERLTQRLHMKMSTFNPEGSAMSSQMRDQTEQCSSDEDSETETDYPE